MRTVFTVVQDDENGSTWLQFDDATLQMLNHKTANWLIECAQRAESSMVDGGGTNAK
jgi:hypothetical protein